MNTYVDLNGSFANTQELGKLINTDYQLLEFLCTAL